MSKTFELQENLLTLPIPTLDETSNRYLEWVEPLITKKQFEKTKNILKDFIDNEGQILQEKLEEWSKENNGNWLKPLWDNMYLDIRDPNVINVNYFIKIVTRHLNDKYSSFEIAGIIISKLIDIYEDIANERFEPEMIKDKPLCMAQYKKMFKATRIPKLNRDEYIVKPKTQRSHIVVMYKNNMFKMDLTDENGDRISYRSIVHTLEKLVSLKDIEVGTSIGVVSTAPRDEAAILLEKIISSKENYNNFEVLKEAIFVVSIDEDTKDLHDFAMSILGSNEGNRYFDKSCQLIFNEKGDFGFNFEHTGVDGTSWVNIIVKVVEELDHIENYRALSGEEKIYLKKLEWNLSEEIEFELDKLKNSHKAEVDNIHLDILHLKDFGKSTIKKLKCSPDAFFHLAVQLAQYRTFNKLRSTYEAVSTRSFLNGRTECNRPVSMEVLEFIEAFENQSCDTIKPKELMHKAFEKHNSRIKDCQNAKGIERHLFGLLNMYRMFGKELNLYETPKLFKDDAYKALKHDFISTSRIESKHFELVGFGPVVEDGFGLWYSIIDNEINMCLTTKKDANIDSVKLFGESIIKSLKDLKKLASE